MRTKLVFATESNDTEYWDELPFIPRIDEWLNISEMLEKVKIESIKTTARCWSGIRGCIQSVEYRQDNHGFYTELYVWCED
jgi:hypothetical protein